MAQERPNRLVEWYLAAKQQAPRVRESAAEWLGQVKEEPRLLWATPAVRYAVYGTGALVAAWCVTFFVGLFTPARAASAKPAATTADFHVVCANPDCGHHFVINRKFGFGKFPVECTKCRKPTGMAARICASPTCVNRWVVPRATESGLTCPYCNAGFQ
jgi:hypothetical protein